MQIHGGTQRVQLDVSLRGTLADEYVHRNRQDPAMATAWLRAILKDATSQSNHPTFLVKFDPSAQKLILGKRQEVGMYLPDW